MKWYQEDNGNTSVLRIMAVGITVLGSGVIVAGVVAFFLRIPEAMQVIGVGAGLIASAEFAKVFQKKVEKE